MNRVIWAVLDKKGRPRAPESLSQVETRLAIRPFTDRVNCQIRSLTSIRKGLGKAETHFIVNSNSIKASEKISEKLFLQTRRGPNPERSYFCQSGGVLILPIRRGPNFSNPEGSSFCQSGGSYFCQSGGVPILPIQKGLLFANPEGSCFY